MDRIVYRSSWGSIIEDLQRQVSFDTNNLFGKEGITLIPLFGKSGYMLPPVRLITDNVPRRPGNVLRERKVEARRIDLPFRLEAPNYTDLVNAQRDLASYLFNSRGDLIFNFADKQRYLRGVSYVDGFLGDDNDDNEFVVWAKFMLTFEAHDPYFYSLDSTENITIDTWKVDPNASPILLDTNFLDNMLGENFVGDQIPIENKGVDTAWVVWTIRGPVASGFTVSLKDGPSLKINKVIEAGEEITIDTRRGHKSVVSSQYGDIFNYLDKTSNLWGFPRGNSFVDINFSGFNIETEIKGEAKVPYSTF